MTKKHLFYCVNGLSFCLRTKRFYLYKADLSARILHVKEKIVYHNTSQKYLSSIKLLNLGAAYQNRHTNLLKKKTRRPKNRFILR